MVALAGFGDIRLVAIAIIAIHIALSVRKCGALEASGHEASVPCRDGTML
jgi:hypothetical protein